MNPIIVPASIPSEVSEAALPDSIVELTRALQACLQQHLPYIPEDVAVFFGEVEVYRYCPAEDSVAWWGSYWAAPSNLPPALEP